MPDYNFPICIDRILTSDQRKKADRLAIKWNMTHKPLKELSNQGFRPKRYRLAGLEGCLWSPGVILRVKFLDGTEYQKITTIKTANTWCGFANINFDVVDDGDAEIRISFNSSPSSWSAIGTECLEDNAFPKEEATMSLGWVPEAEDSAREEEARGTILHEFGHAIGCVHEHQNPVGGIQWDEAAVLEYYSGPPNYWSDEMIRQNIIEKYSEDQIRTTKFDPESIMLYYIPPNLTLNGFRTKFNTNLSPRDKEFIGSAGMYPFNS